MSHCRYTIYTLKNKHISSVIPKRFGGYVIDGVVKEVKRDILENKISLKVDKDMYIFREPSLIIKENEKTVVFVYGDVSSQEVTDEQLLEQMHALALKGGGIDAALQSLEKDGLTYITFNVQ
jgi:hypothetical protein